MRRAKLPTPWYRRAQRARHADGAGKSILVEAMTQMGAGEPGVAAPLQRGDQSLLPRWPAWSNTGWSNSAWSKIRRVEISRLGLRLTNRG